MGFLRQWKSTMGEMGRILDKVPSVTFVMTRCVVSTCNDTFLHFGCVFACA